MGKWVKNTTMLAVVGLLFAGLCACGKDNSGVNLIPNNNQEEKMVNLYAPMGKSSADADNVSMTAQEMTILLAEEKLGLRINFRSALQHHLLSTTLLNSLHLYCPQTVN